MNNRRKLIVALSAGVLGAPFGFLALPHAVRAQQTAKITRVGVLASRPQQRDAFRQGLLEHGWIEGKTILVEYRASDASPERRVDVARELSGLKVDCIVAQGNLAISTLKQVTSGIPIVMAGTADAVGSGFVANLRRPGGNITGLTNINEVLSGKKLELLKALNPKMDRVAVLKHPAITAHDAIWKEVESSARSLGLKVFAVDYRSTEHFEAAFATIRREKADGLLVPASPVAISALARIVSLAAKGRLPAIYQNSSWVEAGGLMSYGPDEMDLWRRAAGYVDKIMKGAIPADTPVEQPNKFELVVSIKTAKALGITISQSVLVQATRVIE